MRKNRLTQGLLLEGESSFVLENDPALISAIIDELHATAVDLGLFDEATAVRVDLALHEALLNAIYHGNLELDSRLRRDDDAAYYTLAERRRRLEPYRSRRLSIRVRVSVLEAVYIIRDEGPGFDPASPPEPADLADNEWPSGRGMLLIRHYMDEVSHNASGNEIILVKRRRVNHRFCHKLPNLRDLGCGNGGLVFSA